MKVLQITNNNQINISKQQNFKAGKIIIKNPDTFNTEALTELAKNSEIKKLAQELSKQGMDLMAEYGLSLSNSKPIIYLSGVINKFDIKCTDSIQTTPKKSLITQIRDYRSIDTLLKFNKIQEKELLLKRQKEDALKSIDEYNKSIDEQNNPKGDNNFWGKIKDFLNLQ